jgi:MscS family membrane protein
MGFWDKVILENSVREYAIVGAIILTAYVFKRFFGQYVSAFFFSLLRSMGGAVDRQSFLDLIVGPLENFLFVLISYISLKSLTFPAALTLDLHRFTLPELLDGLGKLLLIWFFFAMVLRLVDYVAQMMERRAQQTPGQGDNQLVVFFKDFLKAVITVIGLLCMIKIVLHENISSILTGLSIIGAALALAARESLENLIASFILFIDKPFATGDLLRVNQIPGTVERIGLRSTRIRTADKTYVTVPNKQMVDSVVDNMSLRTHRRAEMKILLDSRTPVEKVSAVLAGIRGILQDSRLTDFNVWLNDVSSEGYQVMADYLSVQTDLSEFNAIREEVNLRIAGLLEQVKVDLAGSERSIRLIKDPPSFPEGNA